MNRIQLSFGYFIFIAGVIELLVDLMQEYLHRAESVGMNERREPIKVLHSEADDSRDDR